MGTRRYNPLVAVILHALLLLSAVAGILPSAKAQETQGGSTNIAVQLVAPDVVVPGEDTQVVLVMTPQTGWHGYWSNPGDAGVGMRLAWRTPPQLSLDEPRYPVPETLLISGLMNHVYEGRYGVVVPLKVAADAVPGATTLALEAEWLACTDTICVPERGAFSAPLTIAAGQENAVAAGRAANPDPGPWLARLPAPLDAQARYEVDGDTIRIGVPLPADLALSQPHLFLEQDKLTDYAAPQRYARVGDMLVITIARAGSPRAIPSEGLRAVLRLDETGNGISIIAEPGTVPEGGVPLSGEEPTRDLPALPWLLLAALAGGLILNVMPCVFPILSLKALSLARSGESPAKAHAEGFAYTAGVVIACLLLGGLMLALRAAGQEVGWAFQLQEPGVVAVLLLLAAALTANFLGLFEFAVPAFAGDGSKQGAFATGLLAVFVATPCTGPFMAGAMGAALLLPVTEAMAMFAALGLGIALPFLAVALIPALRSRLPRPGPWMVRFRRWMAVPMGLTALALAWLAWRTGGLAFLVASLIAVVVALWLLREVGRSQHLGRAVGGFTIAGLAAALLAAAFLAPLASHEPVVQTEDTVLAARPFSESALKAARTAGKPVFVWMTADWCLTCKVNERVAIEREETRAAFEKAGVVVLRGDWTRRDPEITRYLTAQGAAGVPLYVWYPAGGGQPEQLPQVLSPGMLAARAD
jgi:DsbC/DsbD-like thiol-disulfide interchange protein/cytochrome c biogenesis protein CcdA